MVSKTQKLICWDASVLIHFIERSSPPQGKIQSVLDCVRKGTHRLAVSTLIYVEVLESTMPGGAIQEFERFIQNGQVVSVLAVDIRVAKKAQEIRNSIHLKTPDAIHIATAITSGAQMFHTFDKKLLKLNGQDEVDGLAITKYDIP